MGREVRKVPADWQHPKDAKGSYIPLLGGSYAKAAAEWDEGIVKWAEGSRRDYSKDNAWKPREHDDGTYEDWAGTRPEESDYMPDWPEAERTHLMMYEDTTEGTPISPAFLTPEELARWLVDNGASSFGSSTGSYEGWLAVAQGGWAPSMIVTPAGITIGVDAAYTPPTTKEQP